LPGRAVQHLVLLTDGFRIRGREMRGAEDTFPAGVFCSIPGLARAMRKNPQELRKTDYNARFIDATTAGRCREGPIPQHPRSHSMDRRHLQRSFTTLRFYGCSAAQSGSAVNKHPLNATKMYALRPENWATQKGSLQVLTPDYSLQRTVSSNGTEIVITPDERKSSSAEGDPVQPLGCVVTDS